MADPVVLVSDAASSGPSYSFGPSHPLQPIRVELALALMRICGLTGAPGVSVRDPRLATREELLTVHRPAYLDAVERLGSGGDGGTSTALEARFGFHSQDNPAFPGMHLAAAQVAGAAIVGAEAVMGGEALHAFVPSGGLHHAHPARAAGFCIYNDPAAAIAVARDRYGARVAYVDVDAHHGDGVQEIFYGDPDVLTISMHESGAYLFPGTGFVDELGEGAGYGYSINIPLEPYAGDAPMLEAVRRVVVPLVRAFKPDLLVTQCGCDSHWLDPLTHLAGTTRLWSTLATSFHDLAHEVCAGRWLATGGGGYDLYSVVPRAWTMLFAGMIGVELPAALPRAFLDLRRRHAEHPMAETFLDPEPAPVPAEVSANVMEATRGTIDRIRHLHVPFHDGSLS